MAYRCGACTKSFKSDLDLYSHTVGGCKGGRRCHLCGHSFGFSPREHMTENHNNHPCSLCDRRFFLERSLEQHMEMSSHEKKRRRREKRSRGGRTKVTPIAFPTATGLSKIKETLASAVVNHLKTTIEHIRDLDIAEVYRSGSTAKGTALESSSDIDIILYCNSDQSTGDFALTTKEDYLRKLQSLIDRGVFNWASNVIMRKKTDFHIGISLMYCGWPFDVDIVISKKSPSKPTAAEQAAKYREMSKDTAKIREHHSSELVRYQTQRIRPLPSQAKEVIRDVKSWNEKNGNRMRSYFVELVVLHKVGEMGESVGRQELLQAVVEELSHVDTMKVTSWPGNTSGRVYPQATDGPVMVDPVNPFNNVAPSFQDARTIVRKLRQTQPQDLR